jgi:hypothetical protein
MQPSNSIQIKLNKPHTHAGVKHDAGDTVTVSPGDAAWLEANGIGAAAPKPVENKAK